MKSGIRIPLTNWRLIKAAELDRLERQIADLRAELLKEMKAGKVWSIMYGRLLEQKTIVVERKIKKVSRNQC